MKLYLAGPMRGHKDLNFPAFDEAKGYLRSLGHDVCNPADHDREVYGEENLGSVDTREVLAWDLAWIAEHADGVAVLDGWAQSSGARAEVALAHAIDLPVAHYLHFTGTYTDYDDGGRPHEYTLITPEAVRIVQEIQAKPLRAMVLEEAARLITGDRNKSYGSPTQNFQNTADMWTVQFRHLLKDDAAFTASHIAQAMSLLKLARMIAGAKLDNWTDLAGYAGCGAECDEAAS